MPQSFYKIASATVGATPVASIDIQNIPQGYDDLLIRISAKKSGGDNWLDVQFNNTANNTINLLHILQADTSIFSQSYASGRVMSAGSGGTSVFGAVELYIPNYTSSNKKIISNNGTQEDAINSAGSATYHHLCSLFWDNTAAINRLTLSRSGDNLVQYSSVTIYGITKS